MNFIFYCYLILFFFSFTFIYFVGYNIFIVLVYLELAALSTSALLVVSSQIQDNQYAEFFAVSLMAAVGAESALAISFLIAISSLGFRLNAKEFSQLKGLRLLCTRLFFLGRFLCFFTLLFLAAV